MIGINDGITTEIDDIKITGIAAAHEFLDIDIKSGRYPYLGFIVEYKGLKFYHAGYTCLYEGMISKLKKWELDIAFLPINGRDAKRLKTGCIGNMTYQEAADLSGALKPKITIPGHYGMFNHNTEDPELFTEYMSVKYPEQRVHVCSPGKRYIFKISNNL